ncbi:acyltransferase [Rothia sp. ZJ1223]|uniref:acyltransferase family protein n=1 Tax=Rothia sp. ZJ1223 TaxID=2811098 RepID=UPI00195C4575|nr:acyltransferase [Rothia sp. ZJ1223]MBM7051392.1 acyltransferase [Rothia sp. ZJ1223]
MMINQSSPTINDAILRGKNSLNFLRFILASFVIIGHAYPLTGNLDSKIEFISGMAVDLFFCASGFLILASAQRGGALSYLWRRFLRIFPGYWVSMLMILIFFVPVHLFFVDDARLSESSAVSYVLNNFDLYKLQWGIEGTLGGNPNTAWNGSAWTLWYEFVAYLCLIPVAFIPFVKKYQKTLITVLFLGSLFMRPVLEHVDATTNMYWHFARLAPMFLAGSLFYVWGDKIKINQLAVWGCVFITFIIAAFDLKGYLYGFEILYIYALLGLASVIKVYWGYRNDLSYGVYIYAFPVQQVLISFGSEQLHVVINMLLTFILTLPFAYLSWRFIEKPALGLKRLVPSRF